MDVVYFLQYFISIFYILSFPNSIICNLVCCNEICFVFFILDSGLVVIVELFVIDCSPSLPRALIIFIILGLPFRIKQIGLGTVLRSFSVDQFEFSKSTGEAIIYLFKFSKSIEEVGMDQSKFIFYESTVNIEDVYLSFL